MSDIQENPGLAASGGVSASSSRLSGKPTLKEVFSIALPMMVSQAAETIMMFTDRLFLSYLGKHHISAAMSGGLSSVVFTSLFTGLIGFVSVLVAQYHGAGRERRTVESTVQGLWMGLFCFPLALGLIPLVIAGFSLVGHEAEQVALESSYFRIFMFGSIITFARSALAGFFLGIGKTRIVMIANLVGVLVNVPFNYILIFGAFGIPAFGIEGAAWGSVAGSLVISLILFTAFLRSPQYRLSLAEEGKKATWALKGELTRRLLRFGTPAGLELFLNVFAFNVFLQLMHSYGADTAAAVTITFNYDLLSFIPLMGIGISVGALVGQRMGAGNPEGAHHAVMLSLRIAFSYSSLMIVLFLAGAPLLVSLFTGGLTGDNSALVDQATVMLRLASLYLLADGIQIIFTGALRGAGDTRWVMVVGVILHYIMSGMAVIFIVVLRLDPLVVWLWFIGFILCLGLVMVLRYRHGHWKTIRVIEPSYIEGGEAVRP